MQLLHYILNCIHLEWRSLFGPLRYMLIQTVRFIVLIISIPDEELFPETTVGCTASYFVKIIWCSGWFCTPPPRLFWGCVLLYLRSPKGGCCSISDDLSCYCHLTFCLIITDSVVLWKIQKFDWLIPETKWHSCLHNRTLCSYLATLRLLRQRENNPHFSGTN